jgi:putative DNA primase/helicase
MPGIFNWCLEGLGRYKKNKRLTPAAEIQAATEEYRKESNTIEEFFNDLCIFNKPNDVARYELSTPAGVLYHAYKEYVISCGDEPIGSNKFSDAVLSRAGVIKKRDEKGNRYIGIGLR